MLWRIKYQSLIWLLGLTLLSPIAAIAQRGGIVGTVTDESGAVVPDAVVTAKNMGTGEAKDVKSSEVGQYTIPNLDVGLYQISAEKKGFRRTVINDVKLEVSLIRTQDLTLHVGDLSQEISVTASATPLETTQSTVGTLLENKIVTDIPLNGRNFLQLQLLMPGASVGRPGTWVAVKIDAASTSIGGGNFTINGTRDLYNDYLLDGMSFKEWIHGTAGMNPSVDAIQEFKTETSNYSAEHGANAGGLVDMATKSGTNAIHGTVFEYLRNDKLDAANFFTNQAGQTKPPLRRNQFGATLGGPIRRDKTFFFGSYEGFRENRSATQFATFPTAAMRVGDFSELLTQSTPVVITDPANNNQPFAGNVIPSNRILPELPGYFDSYVPLPNRPGLFNNFVTSGRRLNEVDQVIGRIDHQISSKTTINGRYVYNRIYDLPFTTNPNFFESQGSLNNNVTLYISHSLSPNTIAYFRAGYNRFAQDLTSNTANTTPNITTDILHINGLSSDPRASGAPFLLPSNFSNLGGSFSQPREWFSERYEYQGGVYHVRGRHNIRGGFHAIRHHETFPEIFIPNGFNTYSGIFSGHSISDMLLGMPDSFAASPDLFDPQFRFWELMPWIQDDWRVTKNLTLNLGVRYERWGRPVSKYDDIANIRLPQGSNQAFIAVAAPCEVSALHACQTTLPVQTAPTRSTINSDNNNFAPRIGLAYRVGGSDKTVLRAAYGVFYQREPINQFIFLSINPPFVSYYSAFYSQANIGTFDFYNPLANQPPGGLQFTLLSDDYRDAYLQQWNIGIQRDLGAGFVADLRYLGNKGTKIVARTWPNQPAPGPGAVDPRRPYTNVGLIAGNEPIGNSNYHSLQFKTEKRFSQGLSLLAAYTWSKAITDTQGAESGNWATAELQDSHDRRANRGLFSGDVRHRFTLSYVYELPIGKGKHFGSGASGVRDKLISGWQAGMIGSFQSGQPLSATLTFDNSNVGEGAKFPDLIGDPNTGPKTVEQFFNTSVFSVPAPLTFGNQGVGVITGPGINVFDLSIVKNTRFRERYNIQFRTEIFNLANHLIMTDPNTSIGSPGFGGVFGTRMDSREIQFALRFEF